MQQQHQPPLTSALSRDLSSVIPPAPECSYAPCFCEENVWKLCDHLRSTNAGDVDGAYAVFVSNEKQVSFTIT